MLDQNEFFGKTVFVAGGTSGINLGIAKAFAAAGARVAVFSRSPERVESALASLRALGAEAMGFSGDVRDMSSVQEALSGTYEAWGSIDILCSVAAGNFVAPAAVMSVNGFKSVMDRQGRPDTLKRKGARRTAESPSQTSPPDKQ